MLDSKESAEGSKSTPTRFSFERIGALAAAIAPISIIVSFVYDWGFFFALGVSFAEAPTTITDHVRSWLVWLPWLAPATIILFGIEFLTRRIERGMTEDEIVESSSNPSRTRKLRNSPGRFISYLGPVMIICWLLFGDLFSDGFFAGLAICWFMFAASVLYHPTVKHLYPRSLSLCFFYIPAIAVFVFYWGYSSAHTKTAYTPVSYKIYTATASDSTKPSHIKLLRSFENWLLIRDNNKRITWIRLGDISRMELVENRKPFVAFAGLVCVFWERLCWLDLTQPLEPKPR